MPERSAVDAPGEGGGAEHEATRERLVEATIELLATNGNHALRLADVARRTGVAVSTIYAHFRDRTDLVAAARLHQFRSHAEEALRSVDEALDLNPEHTTLALVASWPALRAPDDDGSRTRRWDRAEAIADARHIPALADQLETLQSELTARTTELVGRSQRLGIIDPAVDPAALAMLTQVLRLGLVLWDLSGDARPTPEAWAALIDRMADAVTLSGDDQPSS